VTAHFDLETGTQKVDKHAARSSPHPTGKSAKRAGHLKCELVDRGIDKTVYRKSTGRVTTRT
jgi:hypothetical protein